MSYKQTHPYRAKAPLGIFALTKGGPITSPTFSDKIHYELCVDEATRYKWLFLLKAKSETLTNFKNFHVYAERQCGHQVKTIMTDNAKEYMDKNLNAHCSNLGIEQPVNINYSPEENCIAEKPNYTIMKKVRCLLEYKHMDKQYWAEALNYVIYSENRSPTKSPRWQDILRSHLCPKTKRTCVHLDVQHLHSLRSSRAIKCILLGYGSQQSHSLQDCSTGEWFEAYSVKFLEATTPRTGYFGSVGG
ncbi:hypothetical protein LEN26_002230 [Aphanomyces euteiches]|nr:hypothetical protein AeMF1_002262 [Aphanomyces euteiches]KAH9159648.1 hypothetical protein LEN26_002230 [Aphanomyces euteiches]KAH9183135.1 hypothetical protein AeNC1_014888 [Aphanomyces euteiches]